MPKTKPIPVRLDTKLHDFVKKYALFMDISISEALREIIKTGIIKKGHVGMLKKWEEQIEHRNPLIDMYTCDKCASHKNLMIYHIDGNIRNTERTNMAILCKDCIEKLKIFIRSYDPKDKFAAWFFYEM